MILLEGVEDAGDIHVAPGDGSGGIGLTTAATPEPAGRGVAGAASTLRQTGFILLKRVDPRRGAGIEVAEDTRFELVRA
ncbi:hypothetical protein [Tessaracoccus massiliensis]|uniref:hypothetical protein n=1 Tax=Tessaracoccus massiliensis TaxID=1522311 RepID=UPI0009454C57|nr:hypothetical protein [Tessaracoccus massiliensis]